MEASGFIADFILGVHDLKELNLDKFILNKIKGEYNIDKDDINKFILKISFIYQFKYSRFVDIPYILRDINRIRYIIEKHNEILRRTSEYRYYGGDFFLNELIFDNLELFEKDGLFLFKPRIYPVYLLERWYDAWTRPSILCTPREGGQIYFLIPPKYSIIRNGGYRVSIRDDFKNITSGYSSVYSTEDRDYIAILWPCYDPDWMEIKAQIRLLTSIDEYKRYTRRRGFSEYYSHYVRMAFKIFEVIAGFLS